MTLSVSDYFKEIAYAQETDEAFIALVTLTSDELDEPVRIANDPLIKLTELGDDVYGVTSNSQDYVFIPFDIWLPRDDDTGVVSAKIAFENTDRRLVRVARSVTKPVNVHIQGILSSDPDNVEISYDFFQLSNIRYDVMKVEGELTLNYWGLEPFPSNSFTPSNFPGLF